MTSLNRILYVEDEPDIRAIAKIALEKLGKFEVCICASGQQAIDTVPDFEPDLVLLDVMMPGLNGPETLKALRVIPGFENIPAMFMTAKIQPHEIEELMQQGVIDVIRKPFDVMGLSDHLRSSWQQFHEA